MDLDAPPYQGLSCRGASFRPNLAQGIGWAGGWHLCLCSHPGPMFPRHWGPPVPKVTPSNGQDSGKVLPTSPCPYPAGRHDPPVSQLGTSRL